MIALLSAPVGIDKVTKLATFDTYEECIERLEYVEREMKIAYPSDTSFKLECRSHGPYHPST